MVDWSHVDGSDWEGARDAWRTEEFQQGVCGSACWPSLLFANYCIFFF
jgi:hypothetical protein